MAKIVAEIVLSIRVYLCSFVVNIETALGVEL
jgi:hypothetical protein